MQFLDGCAHLDCGRGGRHGHAEAHRDAIRNLPRYLPQKSAALKAENASPNAVQVYGNDGNLDAFHDAFESAAEREQLSGSRDLPFGEDAYDLIVPKCI